MGMKLHYYIRSDGVFLVRPRFVVQHVRTGEYLDAAGGVVGYLDDAAALGSVQEADAAIARQDCRGAWVVRQLA